MALTDLLAAWRTDPNITAWREFPAREARYVPLPPELHPAATDRLGRAGIEALYTHQAAAWQHIQAGRNPVIVTGTASGKTLCYHLPTLDQLYRRPDFRALYLFPTKALAHDQGEALRRLADISAPQIAAYDGDTPAAARPAIREQGRVVITNPDMLHTGILPHHTRWADFFRCLGLVVIDEIHTYRGVFGSHVANTLRRLRRIAHFYGAAPQFILTSATIANPVELAERLIEAPVCPVAEDGAARGSRHFLIYNPPVTDAELGLRRSARREGVRLAGELLRHGTQTILFGRSRRTVEMMLTDLRDLVGSAGSEQIRGYRSGYLPRQRREIEHDLREGRARAVAATNALELGIDIGQLGAAVMVGYPGTIAGTWQQAGRAGRRRESAVAVLVMTGGPLDQFLARHPDYFFERSPEQARLNPDHLLILLQHLRCALFELPFERGEGFGRVSGDQVADFMEFLVQAGEAHPSADRYFWMADRYPAQAISLRSASPETVLLQTRAGENWQILGEVDLVSAAWMVHPQAIYLHQGETYLVESLDLDHRLAYLRSVQVDYYTEPRRETTVQLIRRAAEAAAPGAIKAHGEILVTTQVVGFRRLGWLSHEQLGQGDLDLPPTELQTGGYWLALTEETVERLRAGGLWRSDPNDYGPGWPAQRDRARARDGYRCQICGTPETDRAHDVHHKRPFRTFDSYQTANQLSNLVTLCRTCHRRAEAAVRMRSGLSGLAFGLGRLAPLFLMCDTADLAVHADPRSPLADGRPAVVIYELTPGGIGFGERLFALHATLLDHAAELVANCPCRDGCPSCVGPAGERGEGGKAETEAILAAICHRSGRML